MVFLEWKNNKYWTVNIEPIHSNFGHFLEMGIPRICKNKLPLSGRIKMQSKNKFICLVIMSIASGFSKLMVEMIRNL